MIGCRIGVTCSPSRAVLIHFGRRARTLEANMFSIRGIGTQECRSRLVFTAPEAGIALLWLA